jgi:hydrogenase maturation protease
VRDAARPPRRALVIGYGNALRSDDGFGWHVAGALADDARLAGATVLRLHQLTPELALDISRAGFVVFVDARRDGDAGRLVVEPVTAAADVALSWTHHVAPAVLISLARELYGRAPEAVAVSAGIASLDVAEDLSAPIAAVVPEAIELIVRLVREREPEAVGSGGARGA